MSDTGPLLCVTCKGGFHDNAVMLKFLAVPMFSA